MAKTWAEKAATQPLKSLAKSYGVEKNPLVLELIGKYESQKARLVKMLTEIESSDLTCKKEYVKGRVNLVSHPLIDSCQKLEDSMGRTTADLTDAIIKFGTTPAKIKPKLSSLDKDED